MVKPRLREKRLTFVPYAACLRLRCLSSAQPHTSQLKAEYCKLRYNIGQMKAWSMEELFSAKVAKQLMPGELCVVLAYRF